MKKIIIYGVYGIEIRRKIENYLGEGYCIIGYSDSYIHCDVLDDKLFIDKHNLLNIAFDFLVISVNDEVKAWKVRSDLVNMGIPGEKIVVPDILINKNYIYQKDLVAQIDSMKYIETLILGLSYSLRGIDKSKIRNCYDFSWHGLDLYYNFELLKYANENKKIQARQALLVFPYDYFNYDMSMSRWQYSTGQILAVSRLQDYHNAYESKDIKILNDITAIRLFSDKFLKYYNAKENIFITTCASAIDTFLLGHTWYEFHSNTMEENVKIFDSIINYLNKIVEQVFIIVPPFYRKLIENIEVVEKSKRKFMNIVKRYDVQVLDCFDWIEDIKYFADATHLNYAGAEVFTEKLKFILKLS